MGVSFEVKFFFQRNILIGSFLFFSKKKFFPTFFQIPHRFPIYFTFWIIFQFIFFLTLHFQSSFKSLSLYTFFYIKGTIVEKLDLNFFRELFWFLGVLQPNLRNPIWIHHKKFSPLQTCKCFYLFIYFIYIYIYIFWSLVGAWQSQFGCLGRRHHWAICLYIEIRMRA